MKPIRVASGVLQLVAGIGDEIDPHLLGGAGLALVGEADQPAAVGQRRDHHLPGPAELAEPDQLDPHRRRRRPSPARCSAAAGWRMARRTSDALDMVAEQRPGRRVGDQHAAVAHDQQRLLERRQQIGARGRRLGFGAGAAAAGGAGARPARRRRPGEQGEQAAAAARRPTSATATPRPRGAAAIALVTVLSAMPAPSRWRDSALPSARLARALPLLKGGRVSEFP